MNTRKDESGFVSAAAMLLFAGYMIWKMKNSSLFRYKKCSVALSLLMYFGYRYIRSTPVTNFFKHEEGYEVKDDVRKKLLQLCLAYKNSLRPRINVVLSKYANKEFLNFKIFYGLDINIQTEIRAKDRVFFEKIIFINSLLGILESSLDKDACIAKFQIQLGNTELRNKLLVKAVEIPELQHIESLLKNLDLALCANQGISESFKQKAFQIYYG